MSVICDHFDKAYSNRSSIKKAAPEISGAASCREQRNYNT
jgi:hypothetical protein